MVDSMNNKTSSNQMTALQQSKNILGNFGRKSGTNASLEFPNNLNNQELPLNINNNNNSVKVDQIPPQNLSFINNGHIINNQTPPISTTPPSNFHVNMNITNININQKNSTLVGKQVQKCEKDHIVR